MSVILLKCLPAVLEAVEHGSLGVDVAPAQDGDAEVERGLDHVPGLAAARRHLVQDHVGGAPVSQTTLGRVEFNQCSGTDDALKKQLTLQYILNTVYRECQ